MINKASLIISVYNNVRFLKFVLDALKYQTVKNFEIIISEDAEHAEMKAFIDNYHFENDYQHLTQPDVGWQKNKALNNAVRAAKTDYLIFIDGDCVLHPRFVEMHLRFAAPKRVLGAKRVKLDQKTSMYFEQDFPDSIFKIQKKLILKLFLGKGQIKFIEDAPFISPDGVLGFMPKSRKAHRLIGSNMSIYKSDLLSINGFDEDYTLPAVGEDTDLLWRLLGVGCKLFSVRNLAVQYHLYHNEIWNDRTENLQKMALKQSQKQFVCLNGYEKLSKLNQN